MIEKWLFKKSETPFTLWEESSVVGRKSKMRSLQPINTVCASRWGVLMVLLFEEFLRLEAVFG